MIPLRLAVVVCLCAASSIARAQEKPATEPATEPTAAPTGPAPTQESTPAQEPAAPDPEPEPDAEPEPSYGATARVATEKSGETRVSSAQARDAPGAFGDPLRVIDTLPGVTPIASGLPYSYVRGAPPATLGYSYDDIRLPQLYHFALGPSVLHPRMLGALHFYPGVAPARFGRRLGGELSVDGPPPVTESAGEVELRLLDVTGYVQTPIERASLSASGRYGYPGLLLQAVSPKTSLSYWDYQARLQVPLESRTSVQAIWLGSYDKLEQPPWDDEERLESITLQFHRLELRLVKELNDAEIGSAVRAGIDQSSVDRELTVDALSVGPRMWVKMKLGERARMHMGADFQGSVGEITSENTTSPLQFAGRRQLRLDLPLVADAAARSAAGGFVELHLRPASWNALELGARSDLWIVDGESIAAVDPRLRFTAFVSEALELHWAAGMTHQPAVYMFPLPGLTEVALDRGLQEGLQAETGAALDLGWDSRVETSFFVHHYEHLLLPELYAPNEGDAVPTVDALSYGVELMLRRQGTGDLSGWISYTLGWAHAQVVPNGATFSPEFDVRHVLNVVLQQRLGGGFSAGGRLHLRSGRPYDQFDINAEPIYELRLPYFVRIDARLAYAWAPSWGAMQVYLEWLNLTLAREQLGAECFYGRCERQNAPAIFFPNAGLRAQF